nr:uncharacterized protein LOC113819606 [Penaeus vannamei]
MKVALLLLAGLACAGAASLPALALRPPSPSHQLVPGAGPVKQLRPALRPAHRSARLSGQAAPRTILDTILSILHSLGVSDEEIAAALDELQHQMEIVIADMTPDEILEVQHALDDILNQVNSGEADINQVLVDLSIIYTDIYPHLTPGARLPRTDRPDHLRHHRRSRGRQGGSAQDHPGHPPRHPHARLH